MSHSVFSRDMPRFVAWGLLGIAGMLVWVSGRTYLLEGIPYGNDNSSHLAWIIHIAKLLESGQTDFFFDQQNLGVPMFLAYQPLPGLLMGSLHALTSGWLSAPTLFKGSILLLWSWMPVTWYLGGRWMGMSRTAALLLGLLSLGIQDPQDYGLTFQSVAYRGLYAQLYGMFFLPLSLGSLYRYLVLQEGRINTPILFFWLTFLSHAFFGIYVGIAAFFMLLVRWDGWWRRLGKLLLVCGCTAILLAFWAIPLWLHTEHVGGLPWKTETHNGLPWLTVLRQGWSGALLDQGRWPWLTVIFLFGLVMAFFRIRDRLVRWVLFLFLFSFLMFLGRTQWGLWYNAIPFHRELNATRYLMGLHACVLLLAALGMDGISQWLQEQGAFPKIADAMRKWSPILWIALGGVYLHDRYNHWHSRLKTFPSEQPAFQVLSRYLARFQQHRYVTHDNLGTGSHFYRDYLAALAERPHLQSYGMTFHATLGTFFVESFDFSPTACRLYGVRHLVTHERVLTGHTLQYYTLAEQFGPYRVYEARAKSGMFDFVRLPLTVTGDAKDMRQILSEITLPMFQHQLLPLLQVSRRENWFSSFKQKLRESPSQKLSFLTPGQIQVPSGGAKPVMRLYGRQLSDQEATTQTFRRWLQAYQGQKIPSLILSEHRTWNTFHARVDVRSLADVLLLKVNYFPYWQAYVGKKQLPILRVAPNYMAVHVPQGTHQIRFEYRNPRYQKLLFLLSLLWVGLLVCIQFPQWQAPKKDKKPKSSGVASNPETQRSIDPVGDWIEQHYKKPPS